MRIIILAATLMLASGCEIAFTSPATSDDIETGQEIDTEDTTEQEENCFYNRIDDLWIIFPMYRYLPPITRYA